MIRRGSGVLRSGSGRAGESVWPLWPDDDDPEPTASNGPEAVPGPIAVRPDAHPRAAGHHGRVTAWIALLCGLAVVTAWIAWVTTALRSEREAAAMPVGLSMAEPADPSTASSDGTAEPSDTGSAAGGPQLGGNGSSGTGSGPRMVNAGRVGPARLAGWAHALSPRVGIPEVALGAYGSAELTLAAERPGCHLSWAALAGIGSVESDHGRFRGAALRPDGTSWPRIIGVPLDGQGVARIRDTDGGRLDGDAVYDRAVGPMQFLPSTWRIWGADGDGDGRADPFSLPDAALAAGRYLCASGHGDVRTVQAWTAAVLAYNDSRTYLAEVTARGDAYAARSLGR